MMGWVPYYYDYTGTNSFIHFPIFQILTHIRKMLDRKNKHLKDIVKVLQVYRDNVDADESKQDEGALSQKEILENLIRFLEAA